MWVSVCSYFAAGSLDTWETALASSERKEHCGGKKERIWPCFQGCFEPASQSQKKAITTMLTWGSQALF